MVIKDEIAPEVEIQAGLPTSNSVSITVTAVDGQSGLADSGIYTYYLNNEQKASNNTNTYTYTGLTQGTQYTLKVVVKDKAGKTTEKTTSITTLSIPAGTGAITFTNPTWSSNKASVQVSTNTGYQIEYQVNSTSGIWTQIASGGIIGNLNHNDNVYARLTDGNNVGSHATLVIIDNTPPTVSISTSGLTYNSVTLTVTASDAQSGLADSGRYTYYLNNTQKASNNTNSYTFTGLTDGTQYTLKVVVKDRAGKTTEKSTAITTVSLPTVQEKLKAGDYVYYQDGTGVTRKCAILYDNSSEYGIQIITMQSVENVTLGVEDPTVTGSDNLERAMNSYNNAIETLNIATNKYLNTTYASGARCVGSVPNNPNHEGADMFTSIYSNHSSFNGKFKEEDKNYETDFKQMSTLGISDIDDDYWLASRYVADHWMELYFTLWIVDTRANLNSYENLCGEDGYGDAYSNSCANGLRPVFTLKSNVKVTGGAGTSTSPYTLGV